MNASQDMRPDVYRSILAWQERFAYFFLAASGSAITFALVRTEGQPPSPWMIPVGLAVICWGASFWLGCEHILSKSKALLRNWKALSIEEGSEPITKAHPELVQPALDRFAADAKRDDERTRATGRSQYLLFLLGAIFYLVGHVQHLWLPYAFC